MANTHQNPPAETPASSLQMEPPQIRTHFADHQVLVKYGHRQSGVKIFFLSQFTKPGTLQSATYIDQTDLDWSRFKTVLKASFSGTEHNVNVSDEPTWIGALASMVPGPMIFTIQAKDEGVSTANPVMTPRVTLPLPPQPPSFSVFDLGQPRSLIQAPTIGECELEMQKRQRASNSDGDGRVRKHARTKRVGRRATPFPSPGLDLRFDTEDEDLDIMQDPVQIHQATRKRARERRQQQASNSDGNSPERKRARIKCVAPRNVHIGTNPYRRIMHDTEDTEGADKEVEEEVEEEVSRFLDEVLQEAIFDKPEEETEEELNESLDEVPTEALFDETEEETEEVFRDTERLPNETVAQPKRVVIDLTLDDDDGSQDKGTDVNDGRLDFPSSPEVNQGDTEPANNDSVDNMTNYDLAGVSASLQEGATDELQAFRTSFTVDRCDQETWKACQRFYKITGDYGEKATELIEIPGLSRPLKPHQAFAVYWMLTTERTQNGGYLADDMGLGKTTTAIALCVISRWVRLAWQAVEKSLLDNDGRHLSPDDQKPGDECPSAADFPICCPCVREGPTAKYTAVHNGLNLVVVPKRLIPVWVKEWNDTVKPHDLLRMHLLLGHGTQIKGIRTVTEFQHKDLLMIPEAKEWLHAHACLASRDKTLGTDKMKALKLASEEECGTIPKDADRFVILSAPRSVERHVLQPLTLSGRAPAPKTGAGSRSQGDKVSVVGARFGRAFRDECHEEKGEGTTFKLFKELRSPALWMLSGTPFETSPSDIAPYIKLLERPSWKENVALQYCTSERIKNLGQRFSRLANKADAQLGLLTEEFKLILITLGFIRRTVDSRWHEDMIIKLPPDQRINVECPIPQQYRDAMSQMDSDVSSELDRIQLSEQQARKEGSKKYFKLSAAGARKLGQLRIITSFPGLLDLADQLGGIEKLAFSMDDLVRLKWPENPGACPIMQNLDMVMDGSSKFQYLCGMINEGLTDNLGRPEKLLIMTKHPVTVFILSLALAKTFPEQHVKALWATDKNRQSYVDAFQNYNTGAEVEDDRRKIRSPGILVSTTGVIGTGYTCTRAFRAVLFEPDYLEGVEEQAFARIRRMGQNNPRTTCIRFVGNRRQLKAASERDGNHNARNLTMQELFMKFQAKWPC
ncbi:uncharacterized protein CDV56_103757 [Aspergillus thermomutatus]|uniref:Helicase ATP-binding domain-containing protein n=1 Tax=Aspergillus thermomutatus TaxID=41047 RepID=A0A397G5V8_ASPTH|nr:uncharacterized protein CDV56_103757 [Aspergillus thermomutatus]RHZ45234.1 hypothetical protein CDV56_103757 [Aspergillus thermomutatus]